MDDGGWKAREGEGDRAPRPPFWPCSSWTCSLSFCARPVPALGLEGVEMDAVGGGGCVQGVCHSAGRPACPRAGLRGAPERGSVWHFAPLNEMNTSEWTALKAPPSNNVRVAGVAVFAGVREGEGEAAGRRANPPRGTSPSGFWEATPSVSRSSPANLGPGTLLKRTDGFPQLLLEQIHVGPRRELEGGDL